MATSKLYPPLIGQRIPAFYQNDNDDLIITVPYEDNRAVSKADYEEIYLRVKTVQNDIVCLTSTVRPTSDTLTFIIPAAEYQGQNNKWKVNLGQYYQVQIAYIRKGDLQLGYYSSIGITKFSSMPIMSIEGLEEDIPNEHKYTYKGIYSQFDGDVYWDTTEKAYNYKFVVYDNNSSPIYDTGWLLHDAANDEKNYESFDSFTYLNELENGGYVQYFVETNSGIAASSPVYALSGYGETEDLPAPQIESSFDDGYVKLFYPYYENSYIVREEDGQKNKIHFIQPNETEFMDLTVEQGKSYKYYIYTFDGNKATAISEPVEAEIDFEDILISDIHGRQLKLRFNPNVSSMKPNILESKTDTIGGMYPVISRNGSVKYKEFPVAGLISYHIDDNHLFMKFEDDVEETRESTATKNVSNPMAAGKIFKKERDFRKEVTNWLTNGEPKLFRSAQEGNVIVRLLNVSLSPFGNTSRLVWNFSANAVEICGNEYNDLLEKKFYDIGGMTNA